MRVTTLCKRLLDLDGIAVVKVDFDDSVVVAEVALRRRRLACPRCEFTASARYDTRKVTSRWPGRAMRSRAQPAFRRP